MTEEYIMRLLAIFIMGSEVRQFVHAGLFSELLDSGWSITVMSKIIDDDLRRQLPDAVELAPFLNIKKPFIALELTRILDKAFTLQRSRQGKSSWQYGRVVSKNWRQALLFSIENISAKVLSHSGHLMALAGRFERTLYKNADRSLWHNYLFYNKIDAILVNVPKQDYWNLMVLTAKEMGIETFLIYHTIKDIVANGRLNHDYSGIGVWNSRMKEELLLSNPWIRSETVQVVGCGHFDCVGRRNWLPCEMDFRAQIGAQPNSLIIIYPTAGPGIVPEEERYIAYVVKAARQAEKVLNKKIQIFFRMNPMDNRDVLFEYIKHTYPEHIVLRPDWQDIRKSNWGYARKGDPIFYNALLHFASLCITIPSTVTTDCALAGLPVINLGIEALGEQPLAGSIRAFWEVEFNRNVRESGAARYVATQSDLERAMVAYLMDKTLDEDKREALVNCEVDGIRSGQSSRRSLRLISSGFIN